MSDQTDIDKLSNHKLKPMWINIMFLTLAHVFGPHGLLLAITVAQWKTIFYTIVLYYCTMLGLTAGAHRLWSHRSYKAKLPLQMLLCLFHSMAGQVSIFCWVKTHRLHHKCTDTDADPHNASKGLFFSHIGWLLLECHPDVKKNIDDIDISDIKTNAIIMFQEKYYRFFLIFGPLLLPAIVPWYFFGENFYVAWSVCCMAKYLLSLHATFCINSFAHAWGNRPYDKNIYATQNLFVSWATAGDGWHNYHHVFPLDYRASEFGSYSFNFATAFIDLMAKIGWAYNLKTVDPKLIEQRANRTGDATRELEY